MLLKTRKTASIKNSQLQHDGKWYYYYDKEGNLILKTPFPLERTGVRKWRLGAWQYEWNANGSLKSVKEPHGREYHFKYDAFGRRISKTYNGREFLYIWDKNVLLHEVQKENLCEDNVITWIFEGFTPTAKIVNGKAYSIISDHIGTPLQAIDTQGNKVWERELDIYGRVRKEFTSDDVKDRRSGFMPFLYAGQYFDNETSLCYNRFRYYSPDIGCYISQDPIGLVGGNPTLYGYVFDSNTEVDVFGLERIFTSDDPYVADLANKIEKASPNNIVAVNKIVYQDNGLIATDFDIETKEAVIQVKTKGKGLSNQLERTQQVTDKVVIGYGPKLKDSVVKEAQRRGLLVTTNEQELIELVTPNKDNKSCDK